MIIVYTLINAIATSLFGIYVLYLATTQSNQDIKGTNSERLSVSFFMMVTSVGYLIIAYQSFALVYYSLASNIQKSYTSSYMLLLTFHALSFVLQNRLGFERIFMIQKQVSNDGIISVIEEDKSDYITAFHFAMSIIYAMHILNSKPDATTLSEEEEQLEQARRAALTHKEIKRPILPALLWVNTISEISGGAIFFFISEYIIVDLRNGVQINPWTKAFNRMGPLSMALAGIASLCKLSLLHFVYKQIF